MVLFGAIREECPLERHVRTQVEVVWLEGVRGFRFEVFERGMEDSFLKGLKLSLFGLKGRFKESK